MQVLRYAETIIALGDTFLTSSEAPSLYRMRVVPLGTGQQLALLQGHCDRSFIFTLRGDTLRTSQLRMGTLPICFAPHGIRPRDTLGLQVLLSSLACAQREGFSPILTVWVDDPEDGLARRGPKRRCARRLTVLQGCLRHALGAEGYQKVRLSGKRPGSDRANRFTVSYQI
jgi:hypothetical protein